MLKGDKTSGQSPLNAKPMLFSVLAILLIELPFVHAIQAQYTFDHNNYYQGESGIVTITLYNGNPFFQWDIKQAGIQFDWQQQQNLWFFARVNQNIASGQSYTLSINFGINNNVNVGTHSFSIKYVGMFDDTHTVATGSFYVHELPLLDVLQSDSSFSCQFSFSRG